MKSSNNNKQITVNRTSWASTRLCVCKVERCFKTRHDYNRQYENRPTISDLCTLMHTDAPRNKDRETERKNEILTSKTKRISEMHELKLSITEPYTALIQIIIFDVIVQMYRYTHYIERLIISKPLFGCLALTHVSQSIQPDWLEKFVLSYLLPNDLSYAFIWTHENSELWCLNRSYSSLWAHWWLYFLPFDTHSLTHTYVTGWSYGISSSKQLKVKTHVIGLAREGNKIFWNCL